MGVPSPGWNAPGQEGPRPPHNPIEHDGDKHHRPPNLERNEPVIKYKLSKKSAAGKKGTQDEKDRIMVCVCVCCYSWFILLSYTRHYCLLK